MRKTKSIHSKIPLIALALNALVALDCGHAPPTEVPRSQSSAHYFISMKDGDSVIRRLAKSVQPEAVIGKVDYFESAYSDRGVFTSTGKHLAIGQWSGDIVIVEAESGHLKARLKGHKTDVEIIRLSSTGELVSADKTGKLILWKQGKNGLLDARPKKFQSKHSIQITGLGISPDGQKVISIDRNLHTFLWDTQTGKAIKELDRGDCSGCEELIRYGEPDRILFTQTDQAIGIYQQGFVTQWSTETGEILPELDKSVTHTLVRKELEFREFVKFQSKLHDDLEPEDYVVSQDISLCALYERNDRTINLWKIASKQKLFSIPKEKVLGTDFPASYIFSPDNHKLFVVGEYGRTNIIDIATGSLLKNPENFGIGSSLSVALSAQGLAVLSDRQGTHFFDSKTGKNLGSYPEKSHKYIFSKDGSSLIGDNEVWAIDESNHRIIFEHDTFDSIVPNSDYSLLAGEGYYEEGIWILNASDGSLVNKIDIQQEDVDGMVWSPDSSQIATSSDREISLWDVTKGIKTKGFTPPFRALMVMGWTEKGIIFTNAPYDDQIVQVISPQSGEALKTLPVRGKLAISPDGHWIAAADTNSLVLHELMGKKSYNVEGPSAIRQVSFDSSGEKIILSRYGIIEIWRVEDIVNSQ